MATVGTLGMVLALENKEPNIMQRAPRDSRMPILTNTLLWRTLAVGVLILVGALGLFEWEQWHGASLEQARTVAVNVVVMIEVFYLFNCRSLTHSIFRIGVFSNRWLLIGVLAMILLQIGFTYIPWMNQIMGSAPIGLDAWMRVLGIAVLGYVLIEFEKWWRRTHQRNAI